MTDEIVMAELGVPPICFHSNCEKRIDPKKITIGFQDSYGHFVGDPGCSFKFVQVGPEEWNIQVAAEPFDMSGKNLKRKYTDRKPL